jgi:cytochrome c oxidase cbb3-type subunit I
MSAPDSLAPAADPVAPARDSAAVIDASCRWPLLLLLGGATAWLLLSGVLGILAAIKLHAPGFLAGSAWLTVGRVRPAAMNALVYGFATQASLGVLLWLMARLGGGRLLYAGAVTIAGLLWNLGAGLGVFGILARGPTGFEWLEMPPFAAPLLLLAFVLVAISALLNFAFRRDLATYVTQWYLVAALFWFVWVYSVASYLLLFDPVRGVLQAAVNAWFTGNLLGLWLTSIGLAVVFYFLPQRTGRPLASYWLAVFGFWTLALFGSWNGLITFVGGPLPRWMVSSSVVANGMLVVSVVAVAWNWHLTLARDYSRMKRDWVLRFVLSGAAAYLLASALGALLGLQPVAAITQLTLVPMARTQLLLHGFVGLTLFGAMYDILPRLLQVDWPSPKLIRFHWLASVTGVGLLFVALTIGGLVQGIRLHNPNSEFLSVIKSTVPFLGNASLGLCLLLAAQVAFGWNLALLVWRRCQRQCPLAELWQAVDAPETGRSL